ncbi:septation protein SepH [Mycolicibacterium mengxianglii]|uniref:septation protein SepH n=1 Tax=Mycolicibacterium mengxianglii TaxID=2736649 RepID=UPI0018D196BD|nr:septation protein SepH [Mycolicibacterium mengxianglii]
MRDLKVVGLDVDGRHILLESEESSSGPGSTFRLRVDEKLRAAVRGDKARLDQTQMDIEVTSVLRPRDIQARIRAGASVEQLAKSAGADITRVERFAHPVLLERARAAELATAAHPVLADGPSVLTLLEAVTASLVARGLNPDSTTWDAWRNEDGRWTVQLGWKAGRSDNIAHFRFAPGAHGGTVTAVDEAATELVDPDFDRPLRSVAPLAQLDFETPVAPPAPRKPAPAPAPKAAQPPQAPQQPERTERPARARKAKPSVPAWEDVLLGVRSSGDR